MAYAGRGARYEDCFKRIEGGEEGVDMSRMDIFELMD